MIPDLRGFRRLAAVLLGLAVPALAGAQIPLGTQLKLNPDQTPDLMGPRVAVNASGDFVALWYGFGDSRAYAAYPYPGAIVLTAHGLSQGAAPNYPLIAQSNPTQQKTDVDAGPMHLHAESADDRSAASAQSAAGALAPRARDLAAHAAQVRDDPAGPAAGGAGHVGGGGFVSHRPGRHRPAARGDAASGGRL